MTTNLDLSIGVLFLFYLCSTIEHPKTSIGGHVKRDTPNYTMSTGNTITVDGWSKILNFLWTSSIAIYWLKMPIDMSILVFAMVISPSSTMPSNVIGTVQIERKCINVL